MSVNTLVEYFVSTDPVIEPLSEGIEQWFTGDHKDALYKFRARLKLGFDSEVEKQDLLDDIDKAIDNSNRILTVSDFPDFLGQVLSGLAFNIPMLVRIICRASNGRERKDVRNALMMIHAEVQKAPVKKHK